MRFYKLAAAALLISFSTRAQVLTYSDLSRKYIFKIGLIRKFDADSNYLNTKLKLRIFDRDTKHTQIIPINGGLLFSSCYKTIKTSRSYSTGIRKDAEVLDYDFGDIVVADLNFDNKEDIAVKYDSGGNGGPDYIFYMQDANGQFHEDNYLTKYVGGFPRYIDFDKKTITTQLHATCCLEGKKTFQYNIKTKKWRLVKWKMVSV